VFFRVIRHGSLVFYVGTQDDALAGNDFQRDAAKCVQAAITLIDVVKAKAGWR
jgi:hypothetical protein